MTVPDLAFCSIRELGARLRSGEITAVGLAGYFLDRLETAGQRLNAVTAIMAERALEEAGLADAELGRGLDRGPLHGIPYGLKDIIASPGAPTTWGAVPFKDQVLEVEATVGQRLRDAGAVLLGKLATVELAGGMGYEYPDASLTGPALNPWDTRTWTGGSSSGPAAATAAGAVPFSIGSETGGSIVMPAAWTGITGLRATYGRVSRFGAMALCWSFDRLGPMCRSADDCGLVLEAIAGPDPRDPSSLREPYRYRGRAPRRDHFRIGVVTGGFDGVQDEVRANFESAVDVFRDLGTVEEIELPDFPYTEVADIIMAAEIGAAFDEFLASGRASELTAAKARAHRLAAMALPAHDYLRAQRIRRHIVAALDLVARPFDALAAPMLGTVATPAGENFTGLLSSTYPQQVNLASVTTGMPAISVPSGRGRGGLPTAVQLVGARLSENSLLDAACALEARTGWLQQRPPGLDGEAAQLRHVSRLAEEAVPKEGPPIVRFSRPSILKLALLISATSLVATACGGSSPGSGSGSGTALTVGWARAPDNIDPAITGSQTVESLDINVFQTLIWATPSGALTPDLAASWTVSGDGKTYTFNLRKGVSFQDGAPFNAAAVVANVNFITAKTTQSVSALAGLGTCLSATATATYTVQVHCSAPYAALLANLATPVLSMQSPLAIAKYGGNIQFHLVGTGPFEFVKYVPNQSLVLQRWAKFDWAPPALHQNGPAKAAKLTFDFVPNNGSRISELESGQAQIIEQTPAVYYVRFEHSSSFKDLAVPIGGMGIFMPFNVNRFPTNDAAVRQAISYYVDRSGAIQTSLQGAFPALVTPLQNGVLGYSTSVPQYSFDPAKGDQVLTADGWKKTGGVWTKNGKPLALVLNSLSTDPEYPLILQAVQAQLGSQGIKASIVTNPVTPWENLNASGGMNMTVLEFANSDPAQMLQWYVPGQYFEKWTKVDNPALSSVLNAGQTATSQSARIADYLQAQKIVMNQAYEIPFHVNEDLLSFASTISGIEYEGGGNDFFYQAH